MCLAIPNKVIKIEENQATVQSGHHQHQVNLDLVKNVRIGDYLLIHEKLAINKMHKTEAKKILYIIKNHSNELNK